MTLSCYHAVKLFSSEPEVFCDIVSQCHIMYLLGDFLLCHLPLNFFNEAAPTRIPGK